MARDAGSHSPTASGPRASLEIALRRATELLATNPSLAETQAREILAVVPQQPVAVLVLGTARRRQGDAQGAVDWLQPLVRSAPTWPLAQAELGFALLRSGRLSESIEAFRAATRLEAGRPEWWRALGDLLVLTADPSGASEAYLAGLRASASDPELIAAGAALNDDRIAVAEQQLRSFLRRHPTDIAAIRMLAEIAIRLRRYPDAEALLTRCLELAPGFDAARHQYAVVLYRQMRGAEALREVERLLAADPDNPNYLNLKGASLSRLGRYESAIATYADLLARFPAQPKAWMSYGHALKTVGRRDESIAAYRECIRLAPQLGEAYWSLANLKTFRFDAADVTAIRAQLATGTLSDEDRLHLLFALGKALEDEREYAGSFAAYDEANAVRRRSLAYDADETSAFVERCRATFTAEFFRARAAHGCPAPDPIFVVGLPRAGSTLIEQILATHPSVEGTMELPDIPSIAARLGGARRRGEPSAYPEVVATLNATSLRELGEEYLERTQIQRMRGRPLFIDKMPNNFLHVGLILAILPRARIIDARRHPLGCCFSGFKQHFARGQDFSYSLTDLGRYYRDYVALMAHFDRVYPGRIHRVLYERMVDDTEAEVRRLLAYCGLEFDPACLRFYENDRAVRTASSEQVRRPVFRDGVDHWQNYASWLGPLQDALGPVLTSYPDAPTDG
jgi:tetratricopeptide (TPR) repeat protein